MIEKNSKQMSETFVIGILLAMVGGYLDAYSYLIRDHVFANAETGNMVLFGISLLEGNYEGALHYLIPVLSFGVGIIISSIIRERYKNNEKTYFHWRQIIIVFEIIILIIVAFIPVGDLNSIANVLIAFTCSMQVQTFRKFLGNPYATTMCTGNLRSGAEHLYMYFSKKDRMAGIKAFQYICIIVVFILGAVLGAFFTNILVQYSVLVCALFLIVVFLIMFL